jgi:hypothetical protein
MRYRPLAFFVVFLAAQGATIAQDSPENLILRRAAAAVLKAEPEWKYVPTICNCGPLADDQLGRATGKWGRSLATSTDDVSAFVERYATAEAAASLLDRHVAGKGWSIVPYALADGATMATYPDQNRPLTWFNLTVRKGQFLVRSNGTSKDAVERFARFLVAEISN